MGVVHVGVGEQYLGHGLAVLAEKFVIEVHQLALPHCGGGLLAPQLTGPLGQTQLHRAHADGAGGDQNDLMAHVLQVGEDPGQGIHLPKIHAPALPQKGGGAYFHNKALPHKHYLLFFISTS